MTAFTRVPCVKIRRRHGEAGDVSSTHEQRSHSHICGCNTNGLFTVARVKAALMRAVFSVRWDGDPLTHVQRKFRAGQVNSDRHRRQWR